MKQTTKQSTKQSAKESAKESTKQSAKTPNNFKTMLKKYIAIRGLDIIVVLKDGSEIELFKNREIIDDVIITLEKGKGEKKISLSDIKSVDLFAA